MGKGAAGGAEMESYSHATEPRAVANRQKYRDPLVDENGVPQNIMFDRRVVRGSTYAQPIDTPSQMEELERTKRMATTNRMKQQSMDGGTRARTPDAVDGRKHIDVQTENYLEELTDAVR